MTKCLIVDDSKVIRKVARHILESLDIAVQEACDGQEALDRCGREAVDVILLDWNMPVLNGIEFLHKMGGSRRRSGAKILICTAENEAAQVQMAIDAGADEYIVKPFDRETLQTKLKMVGI